MCRAVCLVVLLFAVACANDIDDDKKKHHRHHHHKHHAANSSQPEPEPVKSKPVVKEASQQPTAAVATRSKKAQVVSHSQAATATDLVSKMKHLEEMLSAKETAAKTKSVVHVIKGEILVNGPLPFDFSTRFPSGVAAATGADVAAIKVVSTAPVSGQGSNVQMVTFEAPGNVVQAVQTQAANPESKLANGALHSFLVAKGDEAHSEGSASAAEASMAAPAPAAGAVDIDVEMPYGDLEPFGREDTAQELTESSIGESDRMVDQLEKAEVAEEKRAVFRALTRLRGAAITSFDGIARSQTGNIDEYNKVNSWRKDHPLHHLAAEESDVSKWAFPDNADF